MGKCRKKGKRLEGQFVRDSLMNNPFRFSSIPLPLDKGGELRYASDTSVTLVTSHDMSQYDIFVGAFPTHRLMQFLVISIPGLGRRLTATRHINRMWCHMSKGGQLGHSLRSDALQLLDLLDPLGPSGLSE